MENNAFWYLKQIYLFEGIPEAEIMALAEQMVDKQYNKKEVLYTPFEQSDAIYILKEGEVTLYHSHQGRKSILDTLTPGSVFGNISFEKEFNTHFAEITEDSYICTLHTEDFMKIVQAKPDIMLRFTKMLAQRLNEYERRMKNELYDSKEKILHYMERMKKKKFLSPILGSKKHLTHEKLAQRVGLSRETVTRAMNELRAENKIIVDHEGTIQVRNINESL